MHVVVFSSAIAFISLLEAEAYARCGNATKERKRKRKEKKRKEKKRKEKSRQEAHRTNRLQKDGAEDTGLVKRTVCQ